MRLDRRPDTGSIVFVTERLLFPPHKGNRARIIELIRALRVSGYRVVLISCRIPSWSARLQARLLVDELITVRAGRFRGGSPEQYDCTPFVPVVREAVRRLAPVAVIAEYLWMAPCLEAVPPGILKMIDTHDLMHVRGQTYEEVATGAWVECSAEAEARSLRMADVVIAIQANEQAAFRALVPEREVICVPHFSQPAAPSRVSRRRREIVAFIGSANAANYFGLKGFVETGWPRIRELRPGAELHVYGSVAKRFGGDIPAGVKLVGSVRDLEDAYSPARVIINPVSMGTGLKIKTVEALARGKALVTTSCGADGLEEGRREAFIQEDEVDRFAAAVAGLLADDRTRSALESSARAFAERRFSREAVLREFLEVLQQHRAGAGDPMPAALTGSRC